MKREREATGTGPGTWGPCLLVSLRLLHWVRVSLGVNSMTPVWSGGRENPPLLSCQVDRLSPAYRAAADLPAPLMNKTNPDWARLGSPGMPLSVDWHP